jgi:hypothetical protein
VKDGLADAIRDRDVLEMDSSIKVFNKAWSWIRLIFGIAAGLLVLVGGGVIWKASDLWSSVDKAKQAVTATATSSRNDVANITAQSKQAISDALEAGKATIRTASDDAAQQSQAMKKETNSFRSDLEGSRQQLQAASKLQPEMESMRKQLAQATSDIQEQQKVISSSQEFVKSVFSSHVVQIFNINASATDRYAIVPPQAPLKLTAVWLLLDKSPIQGTLQLQYYISVQPPDSYFCVAHNLVVFFWGDPPENLKQKPLSVSYFPDTSDRELIHSLSEHDGRVWADDQPLPKINQPDPDFKGNKWIPLVPTPAKP